MAQAVSIIVGAEDLARMAAVLNDRNRPLKHAQRANIIVLSAERRPVQEVARCAGVSRPAIWRWQVHYAEKGVNGLLRDKTRKPGRAPLPPRLSGILCVGGHSEEKGDLRWPDAKRRPFPTRRWTNF